MKTFIGLLLAIFITSIPALGAAKRPLRQGAKVSRQAKKLTRPQKVAKSQPARKKKPRKEILTFSKNEPRTPATFVMPVAGASRLGSMSVEKALEVRGQSRTLSMMLILKNGKENINFVRVRDNYKEEIASTQY